MRRSYLSTIPEKKLVQQLGGHRVSCDFRVTGYWTRYGDEGSLSEESSRDEPSEEESESQGPGEGYKILIDGKNVSFAFYLTNANELRKFIDAVPTGRVTMFEVDLEYRQSVISADVLLHRTQRGSWFEFLDRYTQMPIVSVPWCQELLNEMMRALRRLEE